MRSNMKSSMKKLLSLLLASLIVSGCGVSQEPNEIVVQRFFGNCLAEYGENTDVEAASGECGIITSLLNQFAEENPDIKLTVNYVPWPGYNQLSAQLGAGDIPDVVTMHESAIPDFQSRGLLEPVGEGLDRVGVNPASFTDSSLEGISINGEIYGLPIDTWAMLWHINMNYFQEAGLVENGRPILPSSPEELLEHARQFKQATGKPYLIQASANQKATYARNLYTFLMQQDVDFFADPKRINIQTDAARRIVQMFKTFHEEGLTTQNKDYAAATSGFINGDGGVYLMGTWLISDYDRESSYPDRPLSNGYTVYPYPNLFSTDATYADGHALVMPKKERTPEQQQAVFRLMKFFADNDLQWSRTGHLPSFTDVIESEEFRTLPYRSNLVSLTRIGKPLPVGVQRQFAIQDIIGEELQAAIEGLKSIDNALADAEKRINDLLYHVL